MAERFEAELVSAAGADLGEGPMWDERDRRLWWVDIQGLRLHAFDPVTGGDGVLTVDRPVGAIVPRRSGGFMAAVHDGFASVSPEGHIELLVPVEEDIATNRMNDGKCDRAGRFWAGTMRGDTTGWDGSLYRLDPDMSVRKVLSGLAISNGLGWSPDDRWMYFIDTMKRRVDCYEFDPDSGELGTCHALVEVAEKDGLPDGLCVDAEGMVWVAFFGGGGYPPAGVVRRYDPEGGLQAVVDLPVDAVTSCAFGGDDLGDLYITTPSGHLSDAERAASPQAGGLFRARPGVKGQPTESFGG